MAGILDELRAEVEREKTSAPKKKSVLDELKEEVTQEPRKESELEKIRREVDVNPESLRARRAQGEKLTDEQQKIAFEAERERGLWDMTKGAVKSFFPAAWDITKKLGKGSVKYLRESAPALGSALATAKYSQMPTPENREVIEQLQKQQDADVKRAFDAQRSLASGVAQDLEETANAAVRAAMFGTSITDLAAEKAGLIPKEKSFQNYLAREAMREQERQSAEEYPERASFLLSQSPLADLALDIGTAMQGGTAQEQLDRAKFAKEAYRESMLEQAASFKPDEDISALGEVVSPVGMPARLVKPVAKLTSGAMEGAGGLALRAVTKPTIRGVNPLEGVGLGINWVGDKSETLGKALSRAVTGTEDTAISGLISTPVKTATYLPGKILTGTGRTLRDLGRQIDAGGIRGRTGLLERLGRDPGSADFLRDLFGPGSQKSAERIARRNAKRMEAGKAPIDGKSGGIARARAADWTLRMGNTLAKTGVSGAALNGIIGAADIETAEEFGQSTGTGFGIGVTMGANIPGRVGAALDPTTSFAQKVDQILMTDPEDRRRDEDADLARFRATTDQETRDKIDRIADPNNMVAARERELEDLFQQKAEADYREEDTTALDQAITVKSDELNSLKNDVANLDQKGLDERKRAVELIMLDAFDSLKTNGRAAGLNGVDVRILESGDFENFLRGKWGKNLADAEAIVAQLDGKTDLSPAEVDTLGRAKATVQQFQNDLATYPQQLGFALSDGNYDADTPAHLRMSNIGAPTVGINAEALLRDPGRVGLRYLMQHEGQHALENFKEVQEMQRPLRELFFGRKRPAIDPVTGQVVGEQIEQGIITDEWLDTVGAEIYGRKFGGVKKFQSLFGGSLERQRDYLRAEIMADLSGLSESRYGTIRDGLDSAGQALVDRVLVAKKNSLLGRIRSALYALGVEIDSNGGIQSLLFEEQLGLPPEALALMRQFKRAQRDFTDTLTYTTTGPDTQVEIPITELMTNRGLQEAYKDDVIWDKEQVLAVFDDAGNQVTEIVIPPGTADSAIDEYRMRNGKLVDENGNELTLAPEINLQAIPDGSRVSIDTRIARNPDGSPKILTNKEIKSRARQRNQMIRDAIDNAPDDGSGMRLRDTGNGSYRGTLSPTQLRAIMALPNDVVPPSLKRNTAVFNELLQQGDGSRVLMEYQPALRGGKYRALAPKIRDVVPIGFQFSKDGNFLATTISVSRMFDKMNAWAQKKPDNLNLWGRDLTRFWDDVRTVLDNHNKGLKAEGVDPKDGTMKGTPLDADPAIALEKKNRINDFFNLFNKDTEGLNPSRTKLPVRRGQDSADRVIMSARMDRINQLQVSNAEKLPVDYGKMTVNFMPSAETVAEDLTNLEAENEMEVDDQDVVGGTAAQFLPGIRYTSLPDDPKKTMADFYMLNAMLTTPPTGWSMGKFGGEATMYAPSKDPTGRYAGVRAEKYQDALDEAKQTLIPTLHDKIQKALHFAVGAELRHALASKQPEELAQSEFWQEYARQYAIQGANIADLKKDKPPRRFKNESKGYQDSFVAMENARKKLGMSVADLASFAERMFREGRWSTSYGGKPWGDIAAHLAQMSNPSYSTERVRAVTTDENGQLRVEETNELRDPGAYNAMFQEIDRAYDLQHNTNTVFNKLKKYYLGSEGYGWIARMLDFKANVANPRELRGYVSGTMGKLADAWFADMRADAPITEDLEAKVLEQLPEKLVENIEPVQFLEILKDKVSDYYRKSSSGVVREAPFDKIANDAEGIFRNKGGNGNEWKAIKKDQNEHIGLILDDTFGNLGNARTDAVKLFRMLLVEGKDPRVTGKKPPLPTKVETGLSAKSPSSGGILKATKDMVNMAASSKVIGDGFGEGEWTVKLVSKNSELNTLTLYKGGKPVNSYSIAMTTKGKPMTGSIELATEMINKDIVKNALGSQESTPGAKPPKTKFVDLEKLMKLNLTAMDVGEGFSLVSSQASANRVKLDILKDGKVVASQNFGTTEDELYPAPEDENISNIETAVKWVNGTISENSPAESGMPTIPSDLGKKLDALANFGGSSSKAFQNFMSYAEKLKDPEFIDSSSGNLPPSNIDDAFDFVTDIMLKGVSKSGKTEISENLGYNDIINLGKYLFDLSKWSTQKLEDRKAKQMAEMDEEVEEVGLTPDSPATGYAKPDGTPMTIAEAAAMIGPFDPEEIGGTNHVYFTDNGGTSITNPYEDDNGDPLVTEWAPGNKTAIMQYWADNGVLPSVTESALAIFDAANPGHPYLKPTESEASPNVLADSSALMKFVDGLGVTLDDAQATKDGKWKSVVLTNGQGDEIKIVKQVAEDGMYQFIKDDKNFAIGPFAYVIKEAAKILKQKNPEKKDETAAQKQAMEFLDTMLLEEPITIEGNTWELEGVEDDKGDIYGGIVKLNGVAVSNTIPFDPEIVAPKIGNKAIYDDYFAMDWMKDWKAPEAQSLLTPEQDLAMQAAAMLMDPETNTVEIGGKKFIKETTNVGSVAITGYDKDGNMIGIIPIQGSQNMEPIDLEAAIYEALGTLGATSAPEVPKTEAPKITPQAINEAAEALMNDETASLGKYTFEPIASGLGGTRVNIYIEPGMEDSVGYFMLDPGEYREPSDMLDAFHDKITEFLENNPEFEDGDGGASSSGKFMPASKASLVDRMVKDANARVEDRLKGDSAWLSPKGWVNVDDHLDIFPEDLFDLRRVNYEDLKDRRFVRVRKMGKTLWYEGRPTPKMLKELKDTAVEKRLKLEEDRIEPYGSSARFMPADDGVIKPGNPALFGKKPFFIGVASLLDGKIEETHTYEEAEALDWHHSFLISKPIQEKMESGENVLFWVDPDGKINLDSGQWWNEPIDPADWKRILPEIQKQIKPNPAAKYMPSSNEAGPSLADVPSPISNQGPLSGASLGASFMPGYNPRYTKDDGSFDRDAWLNDRRRAEAELRRRGLSRRDFGSDDEYEQAIRDLLRGPRRG